MPDDRDLVLFREDLASAQRILAAATNKRIAAEIRAAELARWKGRIDKTTVVDAIDALLGEAGLGVDERQAILADAVDRPLDSRGRKPDGADGVPTIPRDGEEQLELPLELEPPPYSDDALALRFAREREGSICYVADWGKWLKYENGRWLEDHTLHVVEMVRLTCREAAAGRETAKDRVRITSKETIMGVERLARSDRLLAATVDEWDRDPWLLNTPGGVIDLRSGALRPHHPDERMTKMTAVAPSTKDCPTWRKFVERVTGENIDLQAFLQRVFGYALTGSTSEHAMFFLYGTGANGKSVLLSTLAGILGGYHRGAPIETFTASDRDRHPTELAMLRGARLVTATETEEGRRWAEAKLKALTGGDRISARLMRQDFFEFLPQFKLAVAGNHKPGLRSVDEAIRRRLHLIPFTVTIPATERDPELGDRLKGEWPGILCWLVDGCLAWQRGGLAPPPVVKNATAAYLDAEDAISAWIDECCDRDQNAWQPTSDLFLSWSGWAKRNGEFEGSTKRFVQQLENRGIHSHRTARGRGFHGLRIRETEPPDGFWSHR